MDVDGSNPRQLTANPADDDTPTWSPDGKQIAFHTFRDGNKQVYVLHVPAGPDDPVAPPVNLTNHPFDDGGPSWRPLPGPGLTMPERFGELVCE